MTYIGGASRSSISKFQASASAVNAAMLAAKTGAAVGRMLDLTKPRASGGNARHDIRHRRPGRDGPIKYPRDRPIFEPSPRRSGAAHPTSLSGRSPDRNGQIGQIRHARQASEKAVEPLCLNCGTSLERIAPESLTPSLSEFVHGNIWWAGLCAPQNHVSGQKGGSPRCWNGLTARLGAKFRGMEVRREGCARQRHCVFAVALLGCGMETNCVACMTPSPMGVGTETR